MSITALATYFFAKADGGSDGWTENWYVVGNDLTNALDLARGYVNPRRAPLCQEWFIEAVRVSDIAVVGDSLEAQYYPAQSKGMYKAAASEEENVCLFCRMEAGALRRRMFPLRGIPQGQLLPDRTYSPTGSFVTAVTGWANYFLSKARLLMRQQVRDDGINVGCVRNPNDDRSLSITAIAPDVMPAIAKKEKFLIAGIPQSAAYGFNGYWVADNLAGGVLTTKAKRKHYSLGVGASGRLYRLTTSYVAISDVIPEVGGTRKTGRPFASPRGRQSATRH